MYHIVDYVIVYSSVLPICSILLLTNLYISIYSTSYNNIFNSNKKNRLQYSTLHMVKYYYAET